MATKSKKKNEVYLELNGSVNIVEVKNGVKSSTPLDGEVVLRALILLIDQSASEALARQDKMDALIKDAKAALSADKKWKAKNKKTKSKK